MRSLAELQKEAGTIQLQIRKLLLNKNGFDEEINLFGEVFASNDKKEGTAAFHEKRPPDFKGRRPGQYELDSERPRDIRNQGPELTSPISLIPGRHCSFRRRSIQ